MNLINGEIKMTKYVRHVLEIPCDRQIYRQLNDAVAKYSIVKDIIPDAINVYLPYIMSIDNFVDEINEFGCEYTDDEVGHKKLDVLLEKQITTWQNLFPISLLDCVDSKTVDNWIEYSSSEIKKTISDLRDGFWGDDTIADIDFNVSVLMEDSLMYISLPFPTEENAVAYKLKNT